MNVSVIDRYTQRVAAPAANTPVEEAEAFDDLGAAGILRGVRERALMLELRMRDGSITAFSYAYLSKASFDPSEGISLHFGGSTVRIIGTNLGVEIRSNVRLFQSLLRHRVPWLQEADRTASIEAHPGELVIDQIRIDP